MSTSFPHLYLVNIPVSATIKEDLLLSLVKVDNVDKALSEYENSAEKEIRLIDDVRKDLDHVVKVYNENVDYINRACKNFKKFQFPTYQAYLDKKLQFPTYQAYLDAWGTHDLPALRTEYDNERAKEVQHYNQRLEETYQLAQTGLLYKTFKQRIAEVFAHASSNLFFMHELNKCIDIEEIDSRLLPIIEPSLRSPKEAEKSSATTASTSSFIPATIRWKPEWTMAGKRLVIGICHEPSWGEKPVAFNRAYTGDYVGLIPSDKLFKFVLIDLGQNVEIHSWEEGADRRFKADDTALALDAANIKFA